MARRFDAFLCHNSKDKPAVQEVAMALLERGLNPWLDRWYLTGGDALPEAIDAAFEASTTCILFLGPHGYGPTQVVEYRRAMNAGTRVIPALLAGTEENAVPADLRDTLWVDLRQGLDGEAALKRLIAGIREAPAGPPGSPEPETETTAVPAVLLAMSQSELNELPSTECEWTALCRLFGMGGDVDELRATLSPRYGDTSWLYRPFVREACPTADPIFGRDRPLLASVQDAVSQLNVRRDEENRPLLTLDWLNDDLFGPNANRRNKARDRMRSTLSLVIVDAASSWHPRVSKELAKIPFGEHTALLWVPPYTSHTHLEEQTGSATLSALDDLNDLFRDWAHLERRGTRTGHRASFALTTEAGIWHWTYRICAAVGAPAPRSANVQRMQRSFQASRRLSPGNW